MEKVSDRRQGPCDFDVERFVRIQAEFMHDETHHVKLGAQELRLTEEIEQPDLGTVTSLPGFFHAVHLHFTYILL